MMQSDIVETSISFNKENPRNSSRIITFSPDVTTSRTLSDNCSVPEISAVSSTISENPTALFAAFTMFSRSACSDKLIKSFCVRCDVKCAFSAAVSITVF